MIIYFKYTSLAVCCYNNEIYIFYSIIHSSLTACCYNNVRKKSWLTQKQTITKKQTPNLTTHI